MAATRRRSIEDSTVQEESNSNNPADSTSVSDNELDDISPMKSKSKTLSARDATAAIPSYYSQSSPPFILPWSSVFVWPLMLTLPLLLASPYSPTSYKQLFPPSWYEYDLHNAHETQRPKPLGLILGLSAVAIGQFWICLIFYFYKYGHKLGLAAAEPRSIQTKGARPYQFIEGLKTHFSEPGGFIMLFTYLTLTWIFRLMPHSYYSFDGTIQYHLVMACLIIQDALQFVMHLLEHNISPSFYQNTHKPHHRFVNPRLFDAFDGSLADTFCMIILPLYGTANLVRTANVWTYMAFGSSYACWLTLIHSEYVFPWDAIFRKLGLGTPADHHVHHKFFKYNFGHLFLWWDQWAGTYRDPQQFAPKVFRVNV